MGGLRSRNKGKRGERQVIDLLQPVVNQIYEAHGLEPPTLQRNTLQSDFGGFDITGLEWLALEVKRQEQLNVAAWWEQTCRQARNCEPVLFYRRNNGAWTVVMYGYLFAALPITAVVRVDVDTFLRWFRARLSYELERRT